MEKVMCIKCGSIGFTASPRWVRCSDCGGRHKVIKVNLSDMRLPKRIKILSSLGLAKG